MTKWYIFLSLTLFACASNSDLHSGLKQSEQQIATLDFEIEQLQDSLDAEPQRTSYFNARIREKERSKEEAERSHRLLQISAGAKEKQNYDTGMRYGAPDPITNEPSGSITLP
ncbi:MAG: hypothetical protein OCD01_16940 [Fibrobacterales bacterium]